MGLLQQHEMTETAGAREGVGLRKIAPVAPAVRKRVGDVRLSALSCVVLRNPGG
jgi:hypothetical protein